MHRYTTTALICALATVLCCFYPTLKASSLHELTQEHQLKLEQTLEAISTQRNKIAQERIPLAQELNQKEAQARELRKEAQAIQRRHDSMTIGLETLRSQIEAEQKEIDYITRTLTPEYLSAWDASLSAAQRPTLGEQIRAYNLEQDNPKTSPIEKLDDTFTILNASITALDQSLGGSQLTTQVLDSEGKLVEAKVAQIGPLVYAATSPNQTGILKDTDMPYPRLITLKSWDGDAIYKLTTQGSAKVPLDPTLGEALALEDTKDTIGEHLAKGGIWVYPILFFALAATLVAILKSITIFSIRNADLSAIHTLILKMRKGDKSGALNYANQQPEPTSQMLRAAAENTGESPELIEEVMYERIMETQPRLERYLNIIAITAATAPLLGLLGTVTGIIKTFELMSVYGSGDPKPLISGISEALITTELGLILAIPALVLHALLSRRAAGILSRMEQTAMAVVNGISRKELVKDTSE